MTSIKIWTNFSGLLKNLKDDEIGRLFKMMLEYAETGEEPEDFEGNELFIWPAAKRDIDMSSNQSETGKANGSKGGRPRKGDPEKNPENPGFLEKTQGYDGFSEKTQDETGFSEKTRIEKNRIEKNRIELNIKEKEKEKEKPLKRFLPPSTEEVKAYCEVRNNGVDAEAFVAFYASKGWKVGNTPMKDWKQAVITWEKRKGRDSPQRPTKTVIAQQYEQRNYSGTQAELIAEQDREMEEWLRREESS